MANYVSGKVIGNQITVCDVATIRTPDEDLPRGESCLLVVALAPFKSKYPELGDVLGVYTDPNGARFAVAAKVA
jgi:hypothetical protein